MCARVARGGHSFRLRVSDKVLPPVEAGHPDAVPLGGQAFAVRGGERGALLSGDVGEGVKEDVSDAFPQGGRLDEGGRPDALDGARGVEAQQLLVAETPEVLPYRLGVVEREGFGRCGGWWRGMSRGRLCWRGGVELRCCVRGHAAPRCP